MTGKETQAGEIIRSVGQIVTDLFPILMEKWAVLHDQPSLQEVEREQVRLERKIERLVNQIRWFYPVFLVLLLWNILLTVFLIVKT